MRRRTLTILAVSLMVITATALAADRRSKTRRHRYNTGQVAAEAVVLPKPALPGVPPQIHEDIPIVPALRIERLPNLKADRETMALHSQAAALITRANPTPAYRMQHFNWIASNPRWRLLGWGGFVQHVEPVPGGYAVTVQVSPQMTEDNRSATAIDYTLEVYMISNGQVQFSHGIDQPNVAGSGVATD